MTDGRYVALLRGVNVGGKTLSMEALRALATSRGLRDVSTFIQSGNLLFTSPDGDERKLERDLETAIAGELGLEVTVIVRSNTGMRAIVENNPFLGDAPEAIFKDIQLLSG